MPEKNENPEHGAHNVGRKFTWKPGVKTVELTVKEWIPIKVGHPYPHSRTQPLYKATGPDGLEYLVAPYSFDLAGTARWTTDSADNDTSKVMD